MELNKEPARTEPTHTNSLHTEPINTEPIDNKYSACSTLLKRVMNYIGSRHLEFGCGKGNWAYQLGLLNKDKKIIGYDICENYIYTARHLRSRENVVFTHSMDVLAKSMSPFHSASLMFVYHEAENGVIESIHDLLLPEGILVVMDYNIKGISREKFADVFTTDSEKKELKRYGAEQAFNIHTAKNLEDCMQEGELAGFKTIEHEILWNKYFKWVGQKINGN